VNGLHLMRPEWLWCLVPAFILAAVLWRSRRRSGSWSAIIAPELLQHLVADDGPPRSRNLLPWLLMAWVLAVLAASGPSLQKIPQPVLQKLDALVIVLDLSYSMKSGDLAPSRIDRARQKLQDLLERRAEGQTALVAFAGDAHVVTPLTDDTRTIANLLPALNPDMMPVPGSDPVAALVEAVSLLESAGIEGGRILLVGDEIVDAQRGPMREIIAESGTTLSIMGVGTSTGAPIPLPMGGFLKDENEAIVIPALDEAGLLGAADSTNGRYMRLQIDDSDLDYLLAENALPLPGETLAIDRTADAWEDQGYLLLVIVLPVALALFRRGWVACLVPLLFLATPEHARAGVWEDLWFTADQQGQRALQQGDPEAAAGLFENPEWAGTASYRAGDYEAAANAFSGKDSADSWYNRGNALARSGQITEAIDAYRESLAREPDRADALENIALLEQLQQQQQEQQQQEGGEESGDRQNAEQDQDAPGTDQENSQQNQDQPPTGDQRNESSEGSDGQQQSPPETGSGSEGGGQSGDDDQSGQEASDKPQQSGDEDQPGQAETAGADGQENPGSEQRHAQATDPGDPEQQERDQAMEQWLRRVPDDPSGLLREKFRYQSQQRERGERRRDAQYW
jgi:Ca-activated chloride channel family protein